MPDLPLSAQFCHYPHNQISTKAPIWALFKFIDANQRQPNIHFSIHLKSIIIGRGQFFDVFFDSLCLTVHGRTTKPTKRTITTERIVTTKGTICTKRVIGTKRTATHSAKATCAAHLTRHHIHHFLLIVHGVCFGGVGEFSLHKWQQQKQRHHIRQNTRKSSKRPATPVAMDLVMVFSPGVVAGFGMTPDFMDCAMGFSVCTVFLIMPIPITAATTNHINTHQPAISKLCNQIPNEHLNNKPNQSDTNKRAHISFLFCAIINAKQQRCFVINQLQLLQNNFYGDLLMSNKTVIDINHSNSNLNKTNCLFFKKIAPNSKKSPLENYH